MRYFDVALPLNFVLATLKDSRFIIVEVNEIPEKKRTVICNNKASDLESVAFMIAIKIWRVALVPNSIANVRCYHA